MTVEEMTEELDLLAERAVDAFCENIRLRAALRQAQDAKRRLELALSQQEKQLAQLQEWLETKETFFDDHRRP
jgi:hypothetical protein